jgi:putative nucleotidyltransferase with HDIG domain
LGSSRALSDISAMGSMFQGTQLDLDQVNLYQKAGHWRAATDLCEILFRTCFRERRLEDALEILLRLGVIYSAQSSSENATEYYELVATISELCGEKRFAARAINGLGVLSQRSGNMEAATSHYEKARALACAADDWRTQGDVELNLGTAANIRGNLLDSLDHYGLALVQYEKSGDHSRMARILNNLGMLYSDVGDLASAAESLEEGLSICRRIGDVEVEGIILTNQTELFIAMGEVEAARHACDDAFEIASRLESGQLKAEALKWLGTIFRLADQPVEAESHLMAAAALAESLQLPLIQAEASRELALLLRSENRNREALDALMLSHTLFTTLHAEQDKAEIDQRLAQLQEDFLTIVERWGESIEANDRYTGGHCRRVAEYACRIATGIGFEARYLAWFRMGAFLHDVGKTEVPEAILNKPGKLTDQEKAIIESHTILGWEMLKEVEFPWDILPMVRSHHERWDGHGYPDRMAGEAIPLAARILHIADVFDALTTARSYRDPLSPSEALSLMQEDSGSFDPKLLDYFASTLPDFVPER